MFLAVDAEVNLNHIALFSVIMTVVLTKLVADTDHFLKFVSWIMFIFELAFVFHFSKINKIIV